MEEKIINEMLVCERFTNPDLVLFYKSNEQVFYIFIHANSNKIMAFSEVAYKKFTIFVPVYANHNFPSQKYDTYDDFGNYINQFEILTHHISGIRKHKIFT